MTTAGLNVPADSQPLPCGERMGAFDARCQSPKIQLVTAALKTSGDESASKTSPALPPTRRAKRIKQRSEEHTSELQSLAYLVCRLLLEKKNTQEQVSP